MAGGQRVSARSGRALGDNRCMTPNVRKHGSPPFRVAVVHGGPGGAGSMAEVAAELGKDFGVLEPIQTEMTVRGQVEELADALREHSSPPFTLVGHSWGAWLTLLVAARRPELVDRLLLVSCGVLEERFRERLQEQRLARLEPAERRAFEAATRKLESGDGAAAPGAFERRAELWGKAGSYELLPGGPRPGAEPEAAVAQARIYSSVWPEAAEMRRSGELLAFAEGVRCPVLGIHGDSDPSPAGGVREPLSARIPDFRFVLLERCGHTPWRERHAREAFFRLVRAELSGAAG